MKCIIQRPATGGDLYVNAIVDAKINRVDKTWGVLESLKVENQFSASAIPREYSDLPVIHKGFCDTHLHAIWMASQIGKLSLRGTCSVDEFFAAIAKVAQQLDSPFVQAYDWDHDAYGITPEELAMRFSSFCHEQQIECVAFRVCGHMALVSEELASRWALPQATLLRDAQLEAVHRKLFRWDRDESILLFEMTQESLLTRGITAISDMSVHTGHLEGLVEVAKRGKLKINVQAVLDHQISQDILRAGPFVEANASDVGPLGRPAELQVRHVKRFLDGSLGSRTAWLLSPYDDDESFGDSLLRDQDLFEWAEASLKYGWLLSFHAIGDGALDQIYRLSLQCRDALKRSVRPEYSPFFRFPAHHRIEHAQVMGDGVLHHLVSQQMWSFMVQPYHRIADEGFAIKRLGPTRFYNEAYRLKSIAALGGARVGVGSDAPIADWTPSAVIAAATSHPNPLERVDWLTAMWLYTTGAKLAMGLDPGKLSSGSTVVISEKNE